MESKLTLGIMQPYFFPYIGYFDLINSTDRWVVFDVVKYQRRSWMNRNRILHPNEGWQYITAPVSKKNSENLIKDVHLDDIVAAEERIMGQLQHYKKSAPHAGEIIKLVSDVFSTCSSNKLAELNVNSIEKICAYIGINFNYSSCSNMGQKLPEIEHAGQWALEISSSLGADCYINPPGGKGIFKQEEFDQRGIELKFADMPDFGYKCGRYTFQENLSIIDVLMWNSAEEINRFLNRPNDTA